MARPTQESSQSRIVRGTIGTFPGFMNAEPRGALGAFRKSLDVFWSLEGSLKVRKSLVGQRARDALLFTHVGE